MERKRRKSNSTSEHEIQRVAIYTRKSKFTGKGDSIANQAEECKEYLRHHFVHYDTMEIDDSFVYEGISGKNTKRVQLQKMMDGVKQGNFDAVICYRLDRISRNTRDFIAIKDELDKYNVKFISTKDDFNTSGPMGEAMMQMVANLLRQRRSAPTGETPEVLPFPARGCVSYIILELNMSTNIDRIRILMIIHGTLEYLRSDNGLEFTANRIREWLQNAGVITAYIEPGSPWENGYCEGFNSRMRDEFLNGELFGNMHEAKVLLKRRVRYYNETHPHSSLGGRPPAPQVIIPSAA